MGVRVGWKKKGKKYQLFFFLHFTLIYAAEVYNTLSLPTCKYLLTPLHNHSKKEGRNIIQSKPRYNTSVGSLKMMAD
jgi:hypothetical protein